MAAEKGAKESSRKTALDAALGQLDRQFGRGTIMRLGDSTVPPRHRDHLDRIARPRRGSRHRRTAARAGRRDLRAGVVRQDDPFPRGDRARRSGAAAPPHSSTRSTRSIRPTPRKSASTSTISSSPSRTRGEQALEITDTLVRSSAVDVVVIDSVAALTPKAEIEGEMGDSHVGLHARLMSQALRKLTGNIKPLQHPGHLHQPDPHKDRG